MSDNKLPTCCVAPSPPGPERESPILSGPCPKCGAEQRFFSLTDLRGREVCLACWAPFDARAFAEALGLSL